MLLLTDWSLGAIYSVLAFFACVMPKASIYIFGIVPMPAWAFVTGIFLWDTSSAILDKVSLPHGLDDTYLTADYNL